MTRNKLIVGLVSLSLLIIGGLFYYQKSSGPDRARFSPIGYGYKSPLSQARGETANFSLLDHTGEFHELYRYSDAKAVVIISQGNDCPIIQKFTRRIEEINSIYGKKNVKILLMNSNIQDDRESIINEAKSYEFNLPIMMDRSQLVAETLGITRTSEAVVLDPRNWKIVYRGSIDDRLGYGVDKQKANNNYLTDVLDTMLKGDEVKVTAVPAKGCLITFEKPKSLSYESSVAPIIQNKCLSCHNQKSEILPNLSSYEKFKGWAQMSRETILTDRMPPFSADTHFGSYRNDISLTPEEKRTLIKWIDQGAPNDSQNDPLKSYIPPSRMAKILNNFDHVYTATMENEYTIPPEGTTEYIYQQLGPAVPKDMWVQVMEMKTTNPRQLHHVSLMVTANPLSYYEKIAEEKRKANPQENSEEKLDGDIKNFLLAALGLNEDKTNKNYMRTQVWGAGRPQPFFVDRKAMMFVPKGSFLILESHYMGTGREEKERSSIVFYQAKKLPKKPIQVRSVTLPNINFKVPAHVKDYRIPTREWTLDRDVKILSYMGHLHMRGKAVKLFQVSPDKKERTTVVSIPNFYYGWQTGAGLVNKEEQLFKKGTTFIGSCIYDNSAQNPNNPDPSKIVHWGQRVDRTEMCKLMMNYYYVDEAQ